MKTSVILPTVISVTLFTLLLSFKIYGQERKINKQGPGQTGSLANSRQEMDTVRIMDCDTSLWKYVYNPTRLEILDKCKTVTGTIVESNADDDGDQHMLLELDRGQEELLNKKNLKKKEGNLVIEAVCANKTSLAKVGNTCNGYINHIKLPKIGMHVKVTGSYVIDSHNGWAEIHPITGIVVLK